MRILIIGGYGNFGSKLANLLKGESELTLILAGRTLSKAQAMCETFAGSNATFEPLKLDRTGDLAAQIGMPTPDFIVDASGPFQAYGEAHYRVTDYAISVGAHYLDLADGTDFVVGISALDGSAKAAGVAVVSGLSTYPALTSAVLIEAQQKLKTVTALRAGISPSPHTDMGRSVIDAITSYSGKPIAGERHGLTEGFMARICPPGAEPIERLIFSDVDVPDGVLFPKAFPGLIEVRNCAGPKPMFLHRFLMALSKPVKWQILPSLKPFAPIIHYCSKHISFGPHRGGMMIDIEGEDHADNTANLSWHLIAEGDDGPHIPAIPAAIVIRKALRGNFPTPGARPAVGEVTLAEYQAVFDELNIQTGTYNNTANMSVYEHVLGPVYEHLPQPIQDLHRPGDAARYRGEANIERGLSPLAQLIGAMARFPKAGENIPVSVDFTVKDGVETWRRNFGGREMVSTQERGKGRYERLVVERFGPIAIGIAMVVKDNQLINVTQGWSIFGIPLPKFLTPGGEIFEHDADGRFNFHVDIKAPLLGRLVRYRGWLVPD